MVFWVALSSTFDNKQFFGPFEDGTKQNCLEQNGTVPDIREETKRKEKERIGRRAPILSVVPVDNFECLEQ